MEQIPFSSVLGRQTLECLSLLVFKMEVTYTFPGLMWEMT